MQWTDDLGVDACNNVIEERVWHLRNGPDAYGDKSPAITGPRNRVPLQ